MAELGLFIVFALRLLAPLTILRWPLWGGIASLIVDALDTNIVKPFGAEIPNYTVTDKYLDLYYLGIELLVAFHWFNNMARITAFGLFFVRLVGVFGFTFTSNQLWLFAGPNLFENFFLFYAFLLTFRIETKEKIWLKSLKKLFIVLFILWLLKLPQEIILHVWRVGSPVETFLSWLANVW